MAAVKASLDDAKPADTYSANWGSGCRPPELSPVIALSHRGIPRPATSSANCLSSTKRFHTSNFFDTLPRSGLNALYLLCSFEFYLGC